MAKLAPNQMELRKIKQLVKNGSKAPAIARIFNIKEEPIKKWVEVLKKELAKEAKLEAEAEKEAAKESGVLTPSAAQKLRDEIKELEEELEAKEQLIAVEAQLEQAYARWEVLEESKT